MRSRHFHRFFGYGALASGWVKSMLAISPAFALALMGYGLWEICHGVAMFCGPCLLRTRLWLSLRVTSMLQCNDFSMFQWPCTIIQPTPPDRRCSNWIAP